MHSIRRPWRTRTRVCWRSRVHERRDSSIGCSSRLPEWETGRANPERTRAIQSGKSELEAYSLSRPSEAKNACFVSVPFIRPWQDWKVGLGALGLPPIRWTVSPCCHLLELLALMVRAIQKGAQCAPRTKLVHDGLSLQKAPRTHSTRWVQRKLKRKPRRTSRRSRNIAPTPNTG